LSRPYIAAVVGQQRVDLALGLPDYFPPACLHRDSLRFLIDGLLGRQPTACLDLFLRLNRQAAVRIDFAEAVTAALARHPGQSFAIRHVLSVMNCPLTDAVATNLLRAFANDGDRRAWRERRRYMEQRKLRPALRPDNNAALRTYLRQGRVAASETLAVAMRQDGVAFDPDTVALARDKAAGSEALYNHPL
jgi:hypothetical protein